MKVGIYTNLYKDKGLEVTNSLVELLKQNSIAFSAYQNLKGLIDCDNFFNGKNYKDLSLMITVGGDGTVLNIAQDCLKYDIPMLPINKGTKGFLTEIELDNLEKIVGIVNGDYFLDERIMIETEYKNKKYYALNEIFVTGKKNKMIKLDVSIGGAFADKYVCDGLLVCTPTGSTAYSLSAGGPIISPNASVMCITPVCSHSLRTRPIVVGDSECVEILPHNDYADAVLTVDGVDIGAFSSLEGIKVYKSTKRVKFWRQKTSNFYTKLLDRLHGLV